MMNWLHDNWLGVILIMSVTTFLFWTIGYFANGLFGYHFDLASCWAGMGAIATAAVAGWGKFWVLGKYCSKEGEMPK
jgi:hypothetical protein